MKTNNPHPVTWKTIAVLSVAALFSTAALAQRIDPATGLPEPNPGDINPAGSVVRAGEVAMEVQTLTDNGQYGEALQHLLAFQQQFKLNSPLTLLLPGWIELGRRYPQAWEALVEIRDQYVREFSEGRGYSALFSEISGINNQLAQDEATCALFQSIRQKDKKLAEQCFGTVAPLLIQRGEFDICLSYIGNPNENFDSLRKNHEKMVAALNWTEQQRQQTAKRMAELGFTNRAASAPCIVQNGMTPRTWIDDNFVNGTRQLIEILAGADRNDEAEEIQGRAVAILDDPRLKSAVSDAEEKIQKKALSTGNK